MPHAVGVVFGTHVPDQWALTGSAELLGLVQGVSAALGAAAMPALMYACADLACPALGTDAMADVGTFADALASQCSGVMLFEWPHSVAMAHELQARGVPHAVPSLE